MNHSPSPLKVGDYLQHPRHGIGQVVAVRPHSRYPDTIKLLYLGGFDMFLAGSEKSREWTLLTEAEAE